MVRGCSGDEGEPRWKLFELKLQRRRISTEVSLNELILVACLPKEGGRLCIGIVDNVIVYNTSKCTTRSRWRGSVLGTKKYDLEMKKE